MPFSHHSHSGQFCKHAANTLQEMVDEAVRQKMSMFAMTDHMPRDRAADLYDEENELRMTPADLQIQFERFHVEARRLQNQASAPTQLLVGMETEWIRPESKDLIEKLLANHTFDLIVGSIHHVHGVPIDYSRELFSMAAEIAEKNRKPLGDAISPEAALFADYYDSQFAMLQAIKPPIVGHFDLVRLLSSQPNANIDADPLLWPRVLRNLRFVRDYGGLLEVNSAALRKGLAEPYPQRVIVQAFLGMNGHFVLSDDSHAVGQIGLNFRRTVAYLQECGVAKLAYLARNGDTKDERFPGIGTCEVELETLWSNEYWI